jgi:putative endonuclease
MRIYRFYVYILTNVNRTVLYVGFSNNLQNRLTQHYKERGKKKHFTSRYHVYYLLYFEEYRYANDGIAREKEIKKWRREKKFALIMQQNPELEFLNAKVCGVWPPPEADSN